VPEGQIQEIKQTGTDLRPKIALFPLENFSEDSKALAYVMPLLREKLRKKGISVIDEDSLDRFLLKGRVRATGYISNDLAKKAGEELNIKAIFVGSINTFEGGKNPQVGFSARLVSSSDGSIIWADHAAATGEDYEGLLGLGRIDTIEDLTDKVMDKLLDSFSMTPPFKEKELTYTIAVMPFRNKSNIKDAGMIATYLFITELFKSERFEPIEFGEVRRLVVTIRVRSKGELDYIKTEAISETSGVDGILVGTVEHYSEETGTAPPKTLISARLLDARNERILWYDGYTYRGDDGISVFDWGRIRSAENVACKVVRKLVKDLRNVEWQ
jgi:TolB-like protein